MKDSMDTCHECRQHVPETGPHVSLCSEEHAGWRDAVLLEGALELPANPAKECLDCVELQARLDVAESELGEYDRTRPSPLGAKVAAAASMSSVSSPFVQARRVRRLWAPASA